MEKHPNDEIEKMEKEFKKDTLTIKRYKNISLCYNRPVILGLFCLIVTVFLILLQSIEKSIVINNLTIYPLPISIFSLFVGFVLLRRHLTNCIKVLLFTGIIVVLVMVGFLTHNAAEAQEPERIIIAGGDSFEPLIFLNSDGKPEGMYVDLWRLWSEKTGVEVELRLMDWDKTIPTLLAGEVDAVDGVTFTPERAKFLDLSDPYAEIPSYIFFHESIGGVRGLADLEGFPVGVIGGSHVEDLLRNEAPKLRPIMYVNYEEIVQTAIQGRLRVFIGEDPMIPFLFAKMGHRITFRRTEKPIISSDMRTAVRKGDTKLLALIERGHKIITPAERQRIRDKWAGVSLTSPIPWRWLIGGVAVLFTGIAFLLIWNTQLQKRVAAATRTIRESEERLRSFANALPDLAFLLDEDGKYLEVLTAEEQLLYKDLSDVKNSYIHEILPSDVAQLSLEIIQKTIATGKTQIFEYKLDFPTGVRWFEARSSPIIETSGDKRMVTCIARDITDRKRAEEALQASEERYRDLVENAVTGFYQVERQGKFLLVNRKMAEMFGFDSPQEFLNEVDNITKIYANPKIRPEILKEIDKKGFVQGHEVEFRTKDGKNIWVKINTRIKTNRDGMVVYEGVMEDITDRKQLETQLQRAQKMEAIGTLAGGIAHDFNNILSPLLGYAEMLKEDLSVDSPLQTNADEILRASLRARDLVQQILAFSRQTEDELKPIKIHPVVKEATNLLRSSLPKTIDIEQNIDFNCGAVIAAPTQIHQILMNLATNAYHAMEDSGGILKVTLKQVRMEPDQSEFIELVPGAYACLTVSDTGVGIEKDILDRIFDPYFTTKAKGKGTGLGLSVVHGIAKSYGGDIRIYSEPGKGTEVYVYLPIMESKAEEKANDVIEPIQGGLEKILLVDDEEAIVRMEQQMLERLGYEVNTRTGSVDALEAFKADPDRYDLIITDMTMPNMTGIRLAKEIKKIRPGIPIIICTGFSDQINEEKCKALGIQGYVMKPIVIRKIAATIREALDKSEKPDE